MTTPFEANRSERLGLYMSASLEVLSLWQPWAILCVAPDPARVGRPAKEHETRHWAPRRRLPFYVAIHATKIFNADTREAFAHHRFKDALKRAGFYPGDPRPLLAGKMQSYLAPAPLGAIVGLATVDAVFRTPGSPADDFPVRRLVDLTADDHAFGHYGPDRFAWRLSNTLMLPTPIPMTGRQEPLYPVPLEAREAINAQLRALKGAMAEVRS